MRIAGSAAVHWPVFVWGGLNLRWNWKKRRQREDGSRQRRGDHENPALHGASLTGKDEGSRRIIFRDGTEAASSHRYAKRILAAPLFLL